MTEPTIVNGVNTTRIFETIDAIKEKSEIAKFNFRATNKWVNGAQNKTTINEFSGACETHHREKPFEIVKDEHQVLLGTDTGANPVEYALTALAGCLTTSLVYHAAAKGIKIKEIESTLEGNLDLQGFLGINENIRNGYENIQVKFKIKSDASPEELEKLVQLAKQRSCM